LLLVSYCDELAGLREAMPFEVTQLRLPPERSCYVRHCTQLPSSRFPFFWQITVSRDVCSTLTSHTVRLENSVYLVFTPKVGEQSMAAFFSERTAPFFFSKTLMSVLTHQLLATDMYFCLFTMFHVAIRFASLMTFRGSKPNF